MSSWWDQRIDISSTYHNDGFSDVDPNAISCKYSIYHHHEVALKARISLTLSLSLSLSAPIIHRSRQVFKTSSCVRSKLMKESPCWSANTNMSMLQFHWRTLLMNLSLLLQHYPACLLRLTWMFLKWEVSGHTAVGSWGVVSRISSRHLVAFLWNYRLALSHRALLASIWCIYTVRSIKVPIRKQSGNLLCDPCILISNAFLL